MNQANIIPPALIPGAYRLIDTHSLGEMNDRCSFCGAWHWITERLAGKNAFGSCCLQGKIKLDPLLPFPATLNQLYTSNSDFRKNVRSYNAALSMASIGTHVDYSLNNGGGPPIYRIHGTLYHFIGPLIAQPPAQPAQPVPPRYAQLYFTDSQTALNSRLQNNQSRNSAQGLDRNVMVELQDMLQNYNPYVQVFKTAYDLMRSQDIPDLTIRFFLDPGTDHRRYNLPTALAEIAAIIPGDENVPTEPRDIICHTRNGPIRRISEKHPLYHPLAYVLLFPQGERGWKYSLPLQNGDQDGQAVDDNDENQRGPRAHMSQREYYAYRLHTRSNRLNMPNHPSHEPSNLHRGGALFQQYVVDCWAATDQERLDWIRNNQNHLRTDLYRGVADQMAQHIPLQDIGRRTILPTSYIGGTRSMQGWYQDSMAIVRHVGQPDLFITMTCNPTWKEIVDELLPGQAASDRPDLISRVFHLKSKFLIEKIVKDRIFGASVARIYTIEFQKRGLPHMHLIVFLNHTSKLSTPEKVDATISAEFPDPNIDPILHERVLKYMTHICSDSCKENNKCTKNFPKPFREATTMGENAYTSYRRRDTGQEYTVKSRGQDVQVNNSHVVPYSPYLLMLLDCHINVECIYSIKSIKYMHKYIYKGHDRISMGFGTTQDEVKLYLDARYVSACEGAWRLFKLPLHHEFPHVERLQIHLPNEQSITFNPENNAENILEQANKHTTLTGFFEINKTDPVAQDLLYQDMPSRFVWIKKQDRHWKLRVNDNTAAIGRMYFVHPSAGERYYLRLLLTVVKGPTCFEDLRTFNGTVYATFKQACFARGMLEDDNEWLQCLEEASLMKTGYQLRLLFVTILYDCQPLSPEVLWENLWDKICDDLEYKLQNQKGIPDPTPEQIQDYGLFLIDQLLQARGKTLHDFPPMPTSIMPWQMIEENSLIAEQLLYDTIEQAEIALNNQQKMNPEQLEIYNTITQAVYQNTGQAFFLHGPAGTGKTFCYTTICAQLRSEGKIVLCVASSGIASLLLDGGRTVHSRFKVPIAIDETSVCTINKTSPLADLIRQTHLIIWDEAPMQHRHIAEAVDRTFQDLRDNSQPFGGITTVLGGDFKQILPVILHGSRAQIVGSSLPRSSLWSKLHILRLTINMRLGQSEGDREYAQWLQEMGQGSHTTADCDITLPDQMRLPQNSLNNLLSSIYSDIMDPDKPNPPDPHYFLNRIILSSRNIDVHSINDEVLKHWDGEETSVQSADSIANINNPQDNTEAQLYPTEFLNSINVSSLPLAKLTLRIGCPLMILRNIDPTHGACNGSRAILTNVSGRVLEVKLIGGKHGGQTIFIPRMTCTAGEKDIGLPFELHRRQFPIRLAFAMTINKSQGQSVQQIGLDLRVPVFTHGQLYVALSRVTSAGHIKVLFPPDQTSTVTKNIVYTEILL